MTGSGFSNIHTCLRAFWMLRRFDFWWNLRVYVWALMFHFHDRLRDLKHTYRLRRCFRRIFVATQTCFWACMYVCLKQFSMTGRGFSNIHTRSRAPGKAFRYGKSTNCVCMFDLCMYVWGIHTCLRASNIHTYMLGRLRHTYIHSWGSMLKQAPGSSKNQVSSRLSRMLQNTYRNQGLDILFGPGRISEFWASEAPMTKSILTLLSMYVRFRLYYVNATGENWVCMYVY